MPDGNQNTASQIATSVDKSNSALQAVANLLTEIFFFLIRHDKLGLQQIIIAIIGNLLIILFINV